MQRLRLRAAAAGGNAQDAAGVHDVAAGPPRYLPEVHRGPGEYFAQHVQAATASQEFRSRRWCGSLANVCEPAGEAAASGRSGVSMRRVAAGPARALVVIALLAGDWHAARAPAIDFARPLPPECAPYAEVVAGIKAMRIYTGAYDRPQRHRAPDSPGGSKLVKPLEERRVNVTGGYEAHFVRARQLLPVEEFFPLDARLRTKVLASDAVAAAEWAVRAERRGTLGAERLARDRAVAQYCGRLRPCSLAILRRDQPPGPATIASKVNVACIAALVDSMGLPDKHTPGHMCHGFPI